MLLIVILFLGPLFRTLPTACLASIIVRNEDQKKNFNYCNLKQNKQVVALKNMAMEVRSFPSLFRKKYLYFKKLKLNN